MPAALNATLKGGSGKDGESDHCGSAEGWKSERSGSGKGSLEEMRIRGGDQRALVLRQRS